MEKNINAKMLFERVVKTQSPSIMKVKLGKQKSVWMVIL